jgi:hypothetical protein
VDNGGGSGRSGRSRITRSASACAFSVSISYHVFVETFLSPLGKICYPMLRKPGRRRFDLFSVLLTVLAIGMSLTLAYQISVYYTGDAAPMAKQSPARPVVGG